MLRGCSVELGLEPYEGLMNEPRPPAPRTSVFQTTLDKRILQDFVLQGYVKHE